MENTKNKVYGIDLGTTYSVLATLDDRGMPVIIENFADSSDTLASAVYFPEGGNPVVGKEAKNQAAIEPDRVVQYVKRQIGKDNAETWNFNGKDESPITISSLILTRIKEYAEEQGHEVKDVVITCPAYFGNEERAATRQAGEIAGLNVLDIVNEPTAAALNYCAREFGEDRKVMVYDLGGGTFDITLFDFKVDENDVSHVDVIVSGGNDRLGGVDWDNRLYDYICELYADESGISKEDIDADTTLRHKILSQVEDVKIGLSKMPSKNITIDYAGDPIRVEISREGFEENTQDLVVQTLDFVHKALSDANLTAEDIDLVLLVGASTKMPMIKNAVENLFPNKVRVEDPDKAVAKGAALTAAIKYIEKHGKTDPVPGETDPVPGETEEERAKREKIEETIGSTPLSKIVIDDKLPRSLGPGVYFGDNYVIDNLLFIGDSIPSEAKDIYVTRNDNQANVQFIVFENVAEDRKNKQVTPSQDEHGNPQYTDPSLKVKAIGELILGLPPNTPKGSEIEVYFNLSAMGLQVRATNLKTNESAEVTITSANTLNEDEMQEEIKRFSELSTRGQI